MGATGNKARASSQGGQHVPLPACRLTGPEHKHLRDSGLGECMFETVKDDMKLLLFVYLSQGIFVGSISCFVAQKDKNKVVVLKVISARRIFT